MQPGLAATRTLAVMRNTHSRVLSEAPTSPPASTHVETYDTLPRLGTQLLGAVAVTCTCQRVSGTPSRSASVAGLVMTLLKMKNSGEGGGGSSWAAAGAVTSTGAATTSASTASAVLECRSLDTAVGSLGELRWESTVDSA